MIRKRLSTSRMCAGRKPLLAPGLIVSLVLSLLLAPSAVVRADGQCRLPEGVPDLLNPQVRANWELHSLGNLEGNPDFPLVLYLNQSDSGPAAVMVAIDARNGKST